MEYKDVVKRLCDLEQYSGGTLTGHYVAGGPYWIFMRDNLKLLLYDDHLEMRHDGLFKYIPLSHIKKIQLDDGLLIFIFIYGPEPLEVCLMGTPF